jgi:polyferredoxin
MPKLYEYFGLVVFFYANEHEPIHVHGEFQGGYARAEFVLKNGKVVRIVFTNLKGKPPLVGNKMKDFQIVVRAKADDIVRRWVDFFVFKKHNKPQIINRKLK